MGVTGMSDDIILAQLLSLLSPSSRLQGMPMHIKHFMIAHWLGAAAAGVYAEHELQA